VNIGDYLRTTAETAVPELRLARWGWRAAIAALLLAGFGFGFWWLFLRPIEQRTQAEQAKVTATLATAAGNAAAKVIPQIQEATRQKVVVDVQVQKGTIDVRQASDAGTAVAGVSAAVVRGNCMLPSLYLTDGACEPVHETPAELGAARSDAGSASQPD